jgi:hypothetical protein
MGKTDDAFQSQLRKWSRRITRAQVLTAHADIVRQHLGAQYDLAMEVSGLLSLGSVHGQGTSSSLLINAFFSNLYHLRASADLTCTGYYGSVRPILRLVFEGLLVAKFSSVSTNDDLYRRWQLGAPLSLRRDVLARIAHPAVPELLQLWKTLCSVTHFSVYAGQPTLELDAVRAQGGFNYSLIFMLLVMNDHLLRIHVIDRHLTYYLDRYSTDDRWRRLRRIATMTNRNVRSLLRTTSRVVAREYISRWRVI